MSAQVREKLVAPIPYGWFHIGFDNQLRKGELISLHSFARDLVLWRDEKGQPHLNDAYCPHLGAHIGIGGKVRGELLECPFHHWQFDGDGNLAAIPYAKKLNEKACLRSYPLQTHYGVLFAWYHPQEKSPSYSLPNIPEFSDEEFVGPISHSHEIKTAVQEMAENTVDSAHFVTVHGHPSEAEYQEVSFKDEQMIMRSSQRFPSSHGDVEGRIDVDTYGFGFSIVRYKTLIDVCMLSTTVPVDNQTTQQHNHVCYHNPRQEAKIDRIGDAFIKSVNEQLQQDIPIWENKIYRSEPLLCDGDGPIAAFRRWAKQFYLD